MIDVEKLKYDLAMQSALIKTLQNYQKGINGYPLDLMMSNFLEVYKSFDVPQRAESLKKLVQEINSQNNS